MTHIQLDYGKTLEFFGQHELDQQKDIVKTIHKPKKSLPAPVPS
jgi:glucose-6-phosphate isomerase